MDLLHKEITEKIIGSAFEVWNELGYGYLEKVYQRAMQVELNLRGLRVELEAPIGVRYKGHSVGTYEADLFVNDCVLVELKIAENYNVRDEPQLLNELKATGVSVGLLINFGRTKVEFKRFVYGPSPE